MISGKQIGTEEIQELTYTKLKSANLSVYDAVPENSKFPYVTIGFSDSIPEDTKTCNGDEITQRLHVWSQYPGFKECNEIIKTITNTLSSQALTATGYQIRLMKAEIVQLLKDPDGLTRHGVLDLTFKAYQK